MTPVPQTIKDGFPQFIEKDVIIKSLSKMLVLVNKAYTESQWRNDLGITKRMVSRLMNEIRKAMRQYILLMYPFRGDHIKWKLSEDINNCVVFYYDEEDNELGEICID